MTALPGPPDLAIEILSPSNSTGQIRAKVADYLAAGTPLVWVADPERKQVKAYRNLLSPRTLKGTDMLDGEDVVAGFRVRVLDLFEV